VGRFELLHARANAHLTGAQIWIQTKDTLAASNTNLQSGRKRWFSNRLANLQIKFYLFYLLKSYLKTARSRLHYLQYKNAALKLSKLYMQVPINIT
jgi:hypothetical protein